MQTGVFLLNEKRVLHYPTLKTVLLVEEVLRNADGPITRAEIKRRLPVDIMHQTLNIILTYLEQRGMIYDSRKGVIWLEPPSAKLGKLIEDGIEV